MTKQAASNPTFSPDDYTKLYTAYTQLAFAYNEGYLDMMRKDLCDIEQIKRMRDKPVSFARAYHENYQKAMEEYTSSLFPLLERLLREEALAEGLSIIPSANVMRFEQIVIVMRKRREERSEQNHILVSSVNNYLFNPLRLPDWNTLGIKSQTARPPVVVPPTTLPIIPKAEGRITLEVLLEGGRGITPVVLHKATTTSTSAPQYAETRFRDLVIGTITDKAPPSSQVQTLLYETEEAYPEHTFYRMIAEGNGFIYVFALNSGNKTYAFYPYQQGLAYIPEGKQYDVPVQADLLLGQPETTTPLGGSRIIIPSTRDYIKIVDAERGRPSDSEQLVVIVSKAEMNMKDIMRQVEAFPEQMPMEERLAKIFGNQSASPEEANVQLKGGTLSYTLAEDDKNVLPITLAIKRK